MRRTWSLVLLLLVGCGGRDPLLGVDDQGVLVPPLAGGSGGGGAATGGTSGTVKPPVMVLPDAGTPKPPVPVPPDAAVPSKVDAAPQPVPTPNACDFPKCVAALQAACTPTGSCVQQRTTGGGGIGNNVCFANGVKVITSISGGGRNAPVTIRVLRADGTGCYTIEPEARGGGVTGLNYRTPSGELVATGLVMRDRLNIVCTGMTAPTSVAASCQPGLMITGCTSGSCQ
jgi:hypothetical protein